jgi:thymidylate synthase (FAD)
MNLNVLGDGIGSVQLIDSMGDDLRVVNVARVSFNKHTDELRQKDRNLIRFLARGMTSHDKEQLLIEAAMSEDLEVLRDVFDRMMVDTHWTPFSHVQITMRLKMPIFVARQWFKHQIGFTRNEVSRRYVKSTPQLYMPDSWRKASDNVKQGSSEELVTHCGARRLLDSPSQRAYEVYDEALHQYDALINAGVCAEQARMVLPQAMYTEFYETGSLAAYARLIRQRTDSHAQREIQAYALAVKEAIKDVAPVSLHALLNPAHI